MAQLWGGRFEKGTDAMVNEFNASVRFDSRLFLEDVKGSMAHVKMLAKQKILTEEEAQSILVGLKGIADDVADGKLEITSEYEDVHSFVEASLIDRIGEAGKKMHTGRSRNDQVALDMRLYIRDEIDETLNLLKGLLETLESLIEKNTETYMPGFTHMQKAQPVTLAHHLGAYFEMFRRDRERLISVRERMNFCPLGSGALAGTTYPLDREYTAKLLGFSGICRNSMDGVSDRDYVIEFLDALSLVMMHLSRFCEEIIMWNSNEYGFVELDDSYSTGSSIMPQKKNPDFAELIRGRAGRVFGDLVALLTLMKGLPLSYNRDMQEDKESLFDAYDTAYSCVRIFTHMIGSAKWNVERMASCCSGGHANATDLADYLVRKGLPFRTAHAVAAGVVRECIDGGIADIIDLPFERLSKHSPLLDRDIYEKLIPASCVRARDLPGGPNPDRVREQLDRLDAFVANARKVVRP